MDITGVGLMKLSVMMQEGARINLVTTGKIFILKTKAWFTAFLNDDYENKSIKYWDKKFKSKDVEYCVWYEIIHL